MTEPWWLDAAQTRPIKVTGGIQINSTRGAVARTWWSKRFLAVLEQIGVGGRMARGRAYARQGQIVSLDVDTGGAVAKVQGSRPRPYAVRVGVSAFGKAEWAEVAQAMVADASLTAALLAGEMPHEIEDVFTRVGLSLFPPSARDLALDCTCPDQAVPCKHLAAVCYVLAERFDADPFAMLALRGRDRETLLADLRERRAEAGPAPSHGTPLAEVLSTFYAGGRLPAPAAGPDTPSDALLDQVPPFPVEIRGITVSELLRPAYRALGGA
ncbi:MAG TPA: SWIM zinc finger family protein [Pseudonocardia sp.]|nr:SWIM zinc finger family protein [Pseudonocardia sp.]